MLRLFQFQPFGDYFPNVSPFCVKVETYLRMAGLPHERVATVRLDKAPKGKLPYIEDERQRVADSGTILEHLRRKYRDPLGDDRLSAAERARGHALRRMLEEHFYWALVYSRWMDDAAWERIVPYYFGAIPAPLRGGLAAVARAGMRKTLRHQGLGRHSAGEVYAAGEADLAAVAEHLGERAYMAGDAPTALDATAYAFVGGVLYPPVDSPLKAYVASRPNLVAYCDRVRAKYY
jgi:glutathione S-transferase